MLERLLLLLLLLLLVGFVVTSLKMRLSRFSISENRNRMVGMLRTANNQPRREKGIYVERLREERLREKDDIMHQEDPYDHDYDYQHEEEQPRMYKGKLPAMQKNSCAMTHLLPFWSPLDHVFKDCDFPRSQILSVFINTTNSWEIIVFLAFVFHPSIDHIFTLTRSWFYYSYLTRSSICGENYSWCNLIESNAVTMISTSCNQRTWAWCTNR